MRSTCASRSPGSANAVRCGGHIRVSPITSGLASRFVASAIFMSRLDTERNLCFIRGCYTDIVSKSFNRLMIGDFAGLVFGCSMFGNIVVLFLCKAFGLNKTRFFGVFVPTFVGLA